MWKLKAGVSADDFENWYENKHVPEIRAAMNGRRYITSKVLSSSAAGDVNASYYGDPAQSYYRMAEFYFESLEDMATVMASPQWKAGVADAGDWIASPLRFLTDPVQRSPSA